MEREKERDRQERGDKMAAVSEVRVDQEGPIWTWTEKRRSGGTLGSSCFRKLLLPENAQPPGKLVAKPTGVQGTHPHQVVVSRGLICHGSTWPGVPRGPFLYLQLPARPRAPLHALMRVPGSPRPWSPAPPPCSPPQQVHSHPVLRDNCEARVAVCMCVCVWGASPLHCPNPTNGRHLLCSPH